MGHLSLSVFEIVLLLFTAIVLGITIHFFITSRRSLRSSPIEIDKMNKSLEEWKRKYFNDLEAKERERAILKQQLVEMVERNEVNAIELEELQIKNQRLNAEMAEVRKTFPQGEKTDYLQQLLEAKSGLTAHNEKVAQLLKQIDTIKDVEEEHQVAARQNKELESEIQELKNLLNNQAKELNTLRQKDQLAGQMSSLLENANAEFRLLQSKIQKLEKEMSLSGIGNVELEDMREAHHKLNKEFEEQRQKLHNSIMENQQLKAQLFETEDKLKEANFERQQLQKKVSFFEELNNDLQTLAESNKKLEIQLKRMAELESMLNVISQEREGLIRKQGEEEEE